MAGNRTFGKSVGVVCEGVQIGTLGALSADAIQVFNEVRIWGLSSLFPNIHVNDVLAFWMAAAICCVPIVVFKSLFDGELLKKPTEFFGNISNCIFFAVGVISIISVLSLELFNMVSVAELGLEAIVDCNPNDMFCNQEEIDVQREQMERQIENALPLSLLFGATNLLVALFTAHQFRKAQ